MRMCIIGSMQYASNIEWIAYNFKKTLQYDVWYVKPSKAPLEILIRKVFEEIRKADIVLVVIKPDGSIGVGTLYEKIYAESLGKEILYYNLGGDDK